MGILDTFYLLFKTDIPSGAKKDIADLDKQIDILAAKGKKRSEEENKEYKELQKRRKEATQDLKDQQKEVDKIGDSFKDLATNALGALTAFATFNGIKNGVLGSARFNADIATQAEVTHQSAEELRAYGAAFATFGGDADAFIKKQFAVRQSVIENGILYKNVGAFYDSIHDLLMAHPDEQSQAINLKRAGITDVNEQAFLLDKNYYQNIKLHRELAAATRDDYEEALKFRKASEDAGTAFTSAFTRIGTDVLPTVSLELLKLNKYIKELEGEKGGLETFFVESAAIAIGAWSPLGRLFAGLIFLAAQIPNIPKIPQAINDSSEGALFKIIKSFFTGKNQFSKNNGYSDSSFRTGDNNENPDYWIAQGYDKDEAKYLANLHSVKNLTKEIQELGGGVGQQYGNVPIIPLAGGGGSSGRTLNVKIDDVTINTQATDASGIASAFTEKMESDLGGLYYDWNDGVDY